VISRTGGQARRITRGGAAPAWTPDGRFIVYATQGSLDRESRVQVSAGFRVEVATGASTRLTMGDFRQPSVSPHGRRVAYWAMPIDRYNRQRIVETRGDIWTVDLDGRHPVRVTNDAASDRCPIWSPDGRFLYYVSDRNGATGIWRTAINESSGMPLGGSVQVATPSSEPAHLTLSRDGRRLAWSTLRRIQHVQRMEFDSDARGPRGVAIDVAVGDAPWGGAEPSPDGSAVVLSSVDGHADLHVARADGSDLRKLTDDPDIDRDPRWSPDGRRIVFQSDRGGANSVWVVNADGSGLRMLARSAGELQRPIWSPEGTRVIVWDTSLVRSRILRVGDEAASDPIETLPQVIDRPFLASDWSPDGRAIAGTALGSIYLYSVESRSYELVGPGANPAWLSDSRRLVYSNDGRLFLVDAATKFADDRRLWREMLAIPGDQLDVPRLSRDNRYLYFTRARTEADLWMMTIK
jgi:Tol biopolymer transport system component